MSVQYKKNTSLDSRASFVADGSYGSGGGGSNPYNYLGVNKHYKKERKRKKTYTTGRGST